MESNCLVSATSDLETDVVECFPELGSRLFACGKYHLNEETRTRVGCISLNQFNEDFTLSTTSSIDRAGVLDCRWNIDGQYLCTAEADGKIGLFSLDNEKSLQYCDQYQLEPESITLAVDWNLISYDNVIGSYSDGSIVLLQTAESKLKENNRFIAHEGEVWTVAFSKHSPFLFFSGGDDSRLKFWDNRMSLTSGTSIASKRYDMGVTCIQASPFDENLIVVGSYDESVSIWDMRNTRRALSDVRVGGGVWRVKWNPFDENIILAACMYNDFRLLKYTDNEISLLGNQFGTPQHTTGKLAYGADWFRFSKKSESPPNSTYYAALCSFYDRIYSCWSFEIN